MKPDYWQKNTRETRNGSRKKDTKRWCKGIEGREHVLEVQVPPNIPGYVRDDCHWLTWGNNWYLCHHYALCTVCGKLVDKIEPEKCPDFTPNGN